MNCLVCDSDDFDGGESLTYKKKNTIIETEVKCLSCGMPFKITYKLTGMENIGPMAEITRFTLLTGEEV
jgi:hypothetical protein